MNQYLIFILGFIIGGVIVYFLIRKPVEIKKETLIEKQAREKAEHLAKINSLIRANKRITNNDVEKLLGISDATATRYFEELGQIGDTGAGVYYEKI